VTHEAEIGESQVKANPSKKSRKTLSQKKERKAGERGPEEQLKW
jgi:hypothetical protein